MVGTPAVFIRFQGCNLNCPWCDQKEALGRGGEFLTLEEVLEKVESFKVKSVVITGGEPLIHSSLLPLLEELQSRSYFVQIESNGTHYLEGIEEFKIYLTLSPKPLTNYFVHPKLLRIADELKFVVCEELEEEVLLRKEFLNFLEGGRVVLQPLSNQKSFLKKALKIAKNLSKKGFKVRVIPQVHKLLGIK